MADIEKLSNFKKMILLREMRDDELEIIAKIAKKVNYLADDVIFSHGAEGGTLYLINKGSVEITLPITRRDSGEEVVAILNEGDCFGELSFFDEKVHTASVVALKDVELLKIEKKDYENVIKENLELGFQIQGKLVQKIINLVREMDARYSDRPFLA